MRSSSGVPDCRSPRNGTAAAETPFSRHHGDVVDPPAGEAECLVAYYSFGGWKASRAHGTKASSSSPAAKQSPAAGSTPVTAASTSASPKTINPTLLRACMSTPRHAACDAHSRRIDQAPGRPSSSVRPMASMPAHVPSTKCASMTKSWNSPSRSRMWSRNSASPTKPSEENIASAFS